MALDEDALKRAGQAMLDRMSARRNGSPVAWSAQSSDYRDDLRFLVDAYLREASK